MGLDQPPAVAAAAARGCPDASMAAMPMSQPHAPGERRLRILLSAYACEPDRGSQPGVGWEWATRLAKRHEVWVLTRANNRPAIERALGPNSGQEFLRFVYLDLPRWVLWLKRKKLIPVPLYYVLWQVAAARCAKRLRIDPDIVHHVTFNGFRFPGKWWGGPGESCSARWAGPQSRAANIVAASASTGGASGCGGRRCGGGGSIPGPADRCTGRMHW